MFTGIVKGLGKVVVYQLLKKQLHYGVQLPKEMSQNVEIGASVAIDGICQTVVKQEAEILFFDAIEETLNKTTLSSLKKDQLVHVERSVKIGDEIGGHLLSGHIYTTAQIIDIKDNIFTLQTSQKCTKYLFPKGFIAIDGVSLTLVDVNREMNHFSVHLIPETLQRTTFGKKKEKAYVNIEIDALTQAAVDTVERLLPQI